MKPYPRCSRKGQMRRLRLILTHISNMNARVKNSKLHHILKLDLTKYVWSTPRKKWELTLNFALFSKQNTVCSFDNSTFSQCTKKWHFFWKILVHFHVSETFLLSTTTWIFVIRGIRSACRKLCSELLSFKDGGIGIPWAVWWMWFCRGGGRFFIMERVSSALLAKPSAVSQPSF